MHLSGDVLSEENSELLFAARFVWITPGCTLIATSPFRPSFSANARAKSMLAVFDWP